MRPTEALAQVERLREQLGRLEMFRAFRAPSTALTGLLALAGGIVQASCGFNDDISFLTLWLVVAIIGLAIVCVEMVMRYRSTDSVLARDTMVAAVRQFQPCLVAGGLITFGISFAAPQATFLLPALWAFCFALGIFAVRPGLPDAARFVAAWYLLAGMVLLAVGGKAQAFSPWWMPVTFGVGQMLSAAVLASAQRTAKATESGEATES